MLTVEELREMNANLQPTDEGESASAPVSPAYEQKDELSQKLNELIAKYDRQSVRFKHVLEERDELSRQVAELRRKVAENEAFHGRDIGEEVRLFRKLMEEERVLHEAARENGSLPPNDNPYAKHNRFIDAFFNIVMRDK